MKRSIRKTSGYILLTLCVVGLFSCLPDPLQVDNIPTVKEEIVVNTQILPEESLIIFLSKSFGALEASDNSELQEVLDLVTVNDAVVIIEGPDSRDTLSFLGTGTYGGVALDLKEGDVYHLYIKSESLGEVYSTTTVMPQVTFASIEAERYFNGFDDTLVQVKYQIIDPVERNFYMMNVQRISFEDPIEERVLNPSGFTKLLDDVSYDHNEIEGEFLAFPRDYASGDTVAVLLSNITQDYFTFVQQRLDNRFGFVEFVSEPVSYHSNIIGGRGFFNLYIPDIRWFVLE